MPQPLSSELHVDKLLTDVALAWSQDQKNFIADKVFPVVPVRKESDLYAEYDRGFFYRNEMDVRPRGGRPAQAGYKVKKSRYSCEEYALEHVIDDRDRENADQPLDPELAGTRLLTTQAMINRDQKWTTAYMKTGVWTTDYTGVTAKAEESKDTFLQFDQAGAESVKFLRELRWEIASTTGYMPNVAVFGVDAFEGLGNDEDVLNRIRYTQRAVTTEEIIASLIGIDKVLVPCGVANTAAEGATDSIDFIVGRKDVLLVYAAPAPSITSPSAGYTFAWTGLIPGYTNAFGGVIEKGREPLAHSDIIQIRAAFDVKAVAPDLGVFLSEAVA